MSITYWNYHSLYDHLVIPSDQCSGWSNRTRAWTSILLDALDVVMLMVGPNQDFQWRHHTLAEGMLGAKSDY